MKHAQPSRWRRGFIFIFFGFRPVISSGSDPPVRTHCPRCGQESEFLDRRYRTWFTIFFIPVFPISGSHRFTQCGHCGAQFQVPASELRSRVAAGGREQAQQAIAMYNSLRASPSNSVTLNQLMSLYASMQEFDQAASAAADFPQALQASEQCMTTLGRVYLAQNKHNEAIEWLDAATQRNPSLGEAQYYKAMTHLMMTPPQTREAIAAARAARNAGYPNAEALLREAETRDRAGTV